MALCAVCGIQAGACTRNAQRERAGRARVGARIRGSPRQLHFSLAMELVPVRVLRVQYSGHFAAGTRLEWAGAPRVPLGT